MRLGEVPATDIGAIETGSLGIDLAIGVGGVNRGRIIEVYGQNRLGKQHWHCRSLQMPKSWWRCRFY